MKLKHIKIKIINLKNKYKKKLKLQNNLFIWRKSKKIEKEKKNILKMKKFLVKLRNKIFNIIKKGERELTSNNKIKN